MSGEIHSRMPAEEYFAIDALSISRLKELRRSPQHYRYALEHPKEAPALTLGTAAHTATLEPERFVRQFAKWDRRSENTGNLCPRNGKWWDAFLQANQGKEILTEDQYLAAIAIAAAVRADPVAKPYLEAGEPEVVMTWSMGGRDCKGRVDWMTQVDGAPVLVGLKSARDCRPFIFGSAAAKLGYHLQWGWYLNGHAEIHGKKPAMVEIVVESAPPHAVVVYRIPDDVLLQGEEEYQRLLVILEECERRNYWPGPATREETLTLPSWVYQADDDVSELGLVT